MYLHHFKINERSTPRGRKNYLYYVRRFWNVYPGKRSEEKTAIFEGHLELIIKRRRTSDILSARIHTGNEGSETPWDFHFMLFGIGFFAGHTAFRKFASWISRCSGYKWDSRDWSLRIFDGRLWWTFAEHEDWCKKVDNRKRHGSFALSPIEWFLGPKRYSYETVGNHQALLKFKDGEYAVLIQLQKMFRGRTKSSKKELEGWTLDVDAPRGIPTHVDHSGGWKGDRTYGFGVKFHEPRENWEIDAEMAVQAWVLEERAKTGFREPDPVGD